MGQMPRSTERISSILYDDNYYYVALYPKLQSIARTLYTCICILALYRCIYTDEKIFMCDVLSTYSLLLYKHKNNI